MSDLDTEKFHIFPQLKEIPQPPKKLYMQGTNPLNDSKFLTVVGSRSFSSYGNMACQQLISGLRGHNISIVSGLALGIDTIAHTTALEAGLHTIAVPGSGLDEKVLYPASNRNLAKRIISEGGMLLSEFEPDFKATVWSFPQRNRIMAGIADAVLIIEAQEKSGTLITARMALDYNRDVLAVPGSIFAQSSQGTNILIKQGATPIHSSSDILEALGIMEDQQLELDISSLSESEQKILLALNDPISKDDLARQDILSSPEMNATLSLLEIKGLIKETGGKMYRV